MRILNYLVLIVDVSYLSCLLGQLMRPDYATQPCHHGPGRRLRVNSSARFFTEPPNIELSSCRLSRTRLGRAGNSGGSYHAPVQLIRSGFLGT